MFILSGHIYLLEEALSVYWKGREGKGTCVNECLNVNVYMPDIRLEIPIPRLYPLYTQSI